MNLLTIGISTFHLKNQVPSDIPVHNQIIPAENTQSQEWLNKINDWTTNQKMEINENKTKAMLFNFTKNYQFTTRLQLKEQTVEVIENTKLLGTIISNDLKWDLNTAYLVKRANNARMQLLRKVGAFGASEQDLKIIYVLFIRSILEQSATVWHSSLSKENIDDLERVQKSATKIILRNKWKTYKSALNRLELKTLVERREELCLNFAIKCTQNSKLTTMFPKNSRNHQMKTRNSETYKVNFAHTDRLKKL